MRVILDICVYCERKPAEIVAAGDAESEDEALSYIRIGENQVLLCPVCEETFAPGGNEQILELADRVVTFAPGIRSIEHTCPALEENGEAPHWATYTLELHRKDDYYFATCEHCGITVRSIATDDDL